MKVELVYRYSFVTVDYLYTRNFDHSRIFYAKACLQRLFKLTHSIDARNLPQDGDIFV